MFEKPFASITYTDVAAFCAAKHPETAQLAYMSHLDPVELPRQVAALANTFGGYLILGVSSSARTGKPSTYLGIKNEAALMDRLKQLVASIQPHPPCTFQKTTAKHGQVFLLIKVHEGRRGPYYVTKEPLMVWIRHDNHKLMIANRTDILHIRDKASRESLSPNINEVFSRLHEEAEKSREANRTADGGRSLYMPGLLEAIPRISMQLSPLEPIGKVPGINSWVLQEWLPGFRPTYATDVFTPHFPDVDAQAIPDGVATFSWQDEPEVRNVQSEQWRIDGSVWHTHSVLQYLDAEPVVYMHTVALELFDFLMATRLFYAKLDYEGEVELAVSLTGVKDFSVLTAMPLDHVLMPSSLRTMLFDRYAWRRRVSTYDLGDDQRLLNTHLSLLKTMHWDVRTSSYAEEYLHMLLWQTGRTTLTPPPLEEAMTILAVQRDVQPYSLS